MAKKLSPGSKINGYEITRFINQGALAIAYEARSPANQKVFFKQYKSPSVTVSWYKAYVDYQKELKRRIESTAANRFTYEMLDFFEAKWGHLCYFQVFEFVEEGHDLEQILEQMRANPAAFTFEQRLTFAKVIMASINALHMAGVIHCDLKPPNIQLFKDDSIAVGYVVKLIDMDFSILSDRRAPWHGEQGYVGSPGYFSPEHLTPGGVPQPASDVFTCGLILYELLGGTHPYRFDDPEEYQKAALAFRARPLKLLGAMPAPASDADVAEIIHRCLSPDAAQRPTARDVNLVLNGRKPEEAPLPSPAPPPPTPTRPEPERSETDAAPRVAPSPEPVPSTATTLSLVAASGESVRMGVTTPVGLHLLRALGEDAKYYHSSEQFRLERAADGSWTVHHSPAAKHQTLLNGKQVTGPTAVAEGDILAVGNEERAIEKLPLTVRLSS